MDIAMKTSDFNYTLPPGLIAQTPIEPRDYSRLLVLNRRKGTIEHRQFFNIIDYLRPGDIMVFNDSRVIPARLKGRRVETGGGVEVLLLRRIKEKVWEALVKPAKPLTVGEKVEITSLDKKGAPIIGQITAVGKEGLRIIHFTDDGKLMAAGEMPLPPYIHTQLQDPDRYQTVYSKVLGSAAAPTAGLHFTPELLSKIESAGVRCLFNTLHVGLDTFRPVMEEDPLQHVIHREYGILSRANAIEISIAKKKGRRIVCVGTTSVRLMEQAALHSHPGVIHPYQDWVSLFILPGHRFRMTDVLVTNFHLPKSTLLMLVTAFAGKKLISKAYREAIKQKYRFYSFGDAMLIY
jgi:S-adenosylmethionine:tRNA ribosyltransferase-isomerase